MYSPNTIIYVLGNPNEPIDSLPIQLLPDLRNAYTDLNFEVFDPTEELPDTIPNPFICIDTVIDIEEITIFEDIDIFLRSPRITVHDFDLPLLLGLLRKLNKLKEIFIIGIPPYYDRDQAVKSIEEILNKKLTDTLAS